MNHLNDIFDGEFVPFLDNLGVDTYKKSFEWMLNDPHFASVLRWLYDNLDQNNALNARENCRYIELEKNDHLLSPTQLEASITSIQDEYPGICLPGDLEAVEDVKLDIRLMQEMLSELEKQEEVVDDLVMENESTKEKLTLMVTRLHGAQQQCVDDEVAAAEECTRLAEDVEKLTNYVMDVVADALDVYSSCHMDKETAKRFFTFGPLESYRQSQAVFMSHYDLYTAMRLQMWQNKAVSEEQLRSTLYVAKRTEEHFSNAICEYIESKAELSGEHAKLVLIANYNNVHSSQVASCLMEDQSAVELLEQEECILDQQMQSAIKQLVEGRTRLIEDTIVRCRLAVREEIHTDLSHLLSTMQQASCLDKLVYCTLRHELCTVARFLHFAADLRQYIMDEEDAVSCRIDSMNDICAEQESCERKLESSDILLKTLNSIFGVQANSDGVLLIKHYTDLQNDIKELNDNINEGYNRKEDAIVAFKKSSKPLQDYIFDGCTKQPNCWDRTLASLMHSVHQEMDAVDKKVMDASALFTAVKNGDKHHLRKFWQWFLTDENKFRSALKGPQISYKL